MSVLAVIRILWALVLVSLAGSTDCGYGSRTGGGVAGPIAGVARMDRDLKRQLENNVLSTIGAGATVLACVVCQKRYFRECHLSRHYSNPNNGCAPDAISDIGNIAPPKQLKSYTFLDKKNYLMLYDHILRGGCFRPAQVMSKRTGISESTISDWVEKRAEIFF